MKVNYESRIKGIISENVAKFEMNHLERKIKTVHGAQHNGSIAAFGPGDPDFFFDRVSK